MTTMDSCSERALPGSFNLITSVRNTLFKSMWLVLSSSHIRETSWSNGSEQQEVKPIRRWKWRNETKSFWSELWCEGRVWTHGGILRLWCDPRSEPWPLITVSLCFSNMNKRRKKTRQQPQFLYLTSSLLFPTLFDTSQNLLEKQALQYTDVWQKSEVTLKRLFFIK